MRVLTARGGLPVNAMTLTSRVRTPQGYNTVKNIAKEQYGFARTYIIETYANTIEIECAKATEVLTEVGWRKIGTLKEGAAVCVKGTFVENRFSVIKSLKVSKIHNAFIYYPSVDNPIYINNLLVK